MKDEKDRLALGAVLVGLGTGIAAFGAVLVVPALMSRASSTFAGVSDKLKDSVRSGLHSASDVFNEVASRSQVPIGEAAKAMKHTTAVAAGAIESAARHIREQVQ